MMPRIASTANIIEIKLMMIVIKYNLQEIANLMRTMFAEWIDNGHNNFDDVNTCILLSVFFDDFSYIKSRQWPALVRADSII